MIDGTAETRESWLTGALGLVPKEPGDRLYAASQVTHGEVNFRIESVPGNTVADRLAAYYNRKSSTTVKVSSILATVSVRLRRLKRLISL